MQHRLRILALAVAGLALGWFVVGQLDAGSTPGRDSVAPVVTEVSYRADLSTLFAHGWEAAPLEDTRAQLLELAVPADMRDLHLELAIALGLPDAEAAARVADLRETYSF